MAVSEMKIMVYDHNLKPLYPLMNWESCEVNQNTDKVGTASIELSSDHDFATDLHTDGRRVVITTRNGIHLLSGPITSISTHSPAAASYLSIKVEDDARLFEQMLGWVRPTLGPDMQSSEDSSAQWHMRGKAETVFKELVRQNIARLGLPYRIADDKMRGADVELTSRMSKISDVIYPTVTNAGVIPVVRQRAAALGNQEVVIDVIAPTNRMPIISAYSPQVIQWTYTKSAPTAMQGVAGGAGEGNNRVFVYYPNASGMGTWGPYWAGEIFQDGRQQKNAGPLYDALKADIDAAGVNVEMEIELRETDEWQFGSAWLLGDSIRVRMIKGVPTLSVPITNMMHSEYKTSGYTVKASCSPRGSVKTLTDTVYQLSRRIRKLETGY